MKRLFEKWIASPEGFKKLNGWLTIVWLALAFPICAFLSDSVPFLVFVSVYAVAAAHLGTWAGARTEVRQIEQAETVGSAEVVEHAEKVEENNTPT